MGMRGGKRVMDSKQEIRETKRSTFCAIIFWLLVLNKYIKGLTNTVMPTAILHMYYGELPSAQYRVLILVLKNQIVFTDCRTAGILVL